jgi:uncharacterized protein YbjT (DUF2867 family)
MVAVFGGTGFLGRRIVQRLLDHGLSVRIASRHPERGEGIFRATSSQLEFARADVSDNALIGAVVAGAFGVINAVSLYVEGRRQTFHSVHVEAAARVAMHARHSHAARLIHVSGIGADSTSLSPYIRSRGEGESAVRAAFPAAFLIPLIKLLRKSPMFPLFGRGRTALQPAYVEDVGEAIARMLDSSAAKTVYELGGPQIYSYKDLLRMIGAHLGSRRVLVPVPFVVWQMLAFLAESWPRPPITPNQVELMRIDNVASPTCAGFRTLGIEPHGIDAMFRSSKQ